MLLAPEKTRFVRGTTPLLLLADAPVHTALPLLASPGETVPVCEGWSIARRPTLCALDGPGDLGLVIPAFAAPVLDAPDTAPGAMADWCTDAERAGGALVLSMDRLPEAIDWTSLLSPATTHGGFLPTLT